jgi:hypothetical protein
MDGEVRRDHLLAASAYRLSSLSPAPYGRHYLRQEPDAGIPLVRIRGGGYERSRSLLRLQSCLTRDLPQFDSICGAMGYQRVGFYEIVRQLIDATSVRL